MAGRNQSDQNRDSSTSNTNRKRIIPCKKTIHRFIGHDGMITSSKQYRFNSIIVNGTSFDTRKRQTTTNTPYQSRAMNTYICQPFLRLTLVQIGSRSANGFQLQRLWGWPALRRAQIVHHQSHYRKPAEVFKKNARASDRGKACGVKVKISLRQNQESHVT